MSRLGTTTTKHGYCLSLTYRSPHGAHTRQAPQRTLPIHTRIPNPPYRTVARSRSHPRAASALPSATRPNLWNLQGTCLEWTCFFLLSEIRRRGGFQTHSATRLLLVTAGSSTVAVVWYNRSHPKIEMQRHVILDDTARHTSPSAGTRESLVLSPRRPLIARWSRGDEPERVHRSRGSCAAGESPPAGAIGQSRQW